MTAKKYYPHECFMGDGPFALLTTQSLGGGAMCAEQIVDALAPDSLDGKQRLLEERICLPIMLESDCVLDNTAVTLGPLTPQEEAEWIARIRGTLHLPCGTLVATACWDELERLSEAELDQETFFSVTVPPGTYRVDFLVYVGSSEAYRWFDWMGGEENILSYWKATRPDQPIPHWLENAGDDLSDELQGTVVLLTPLTEDSELPALSEDSGWVEEFELRKPPLAPLGIPSERPEPS